ncbi:MAG TPA: DUF4350 domain-containing protein, partial [Vicinamibacterales bacterium]
SPGGARAAYLTLKDLGYTIERSFDPVAALTAPAANSLLVIAEPIEAPSDQDRRAVRNFVEKGGTLVAMGRIAGQFFARGEPEPRDQSTERQYRPATSNDLTQDVTAIDSAPEGASPIPRAEFTPLFGTEKDAPVRMARFGSGRAIWASSAAAFTNARLAERGNLQWLLNVAGPPGARTILWDERYHGHTRSVWSYAARTPLPWALGQLGLVALAAAATFSRRRGPVRPPVVDTRTAPMEFVETMGQLYKRANAEQASVEAARARLRRLLLETTGMPAASSTAALVRAAAARTSIPAGTLNALLDPSSIDTQADALQTVQGLQRVAAALANEQRGAGRGRQ